MDGNKILKNIVIGGLFLVPFLPFIVAPSMYFPFITGKNFVFRIIIEIIFAVWVALVVLDKNFLPKKSNLLKAVLVFVGIIAVADIFGINFYRSFWSNYERMEGLISLFHILAYTVMLASVFNEKLWGYYFKTIFVSAVGLMVFGGMQLVGLAKINQGGVRLDATFGNSTYFAVHMLFVAFLSAFYLFKNKIGNNVATWLYGIILALSVFMLFETATRGTAIGLIIGTILAAGLITVKGENEKHKQTAKYVLGSLAVLFLIFLSIRNIPSVRSNPILGRFAELDATTIMNQPRYKVWNMAWQGFKEHPILGWGQENFNVVFNKYYDPGMYAQEPWFDRAHDVFFDWLIAGGILGLLSYLSIFYFAICAIWREGAERFSLEGKSVLTGLLAGYFIHNFFVFDNLMSYVMFFTVVAYIYHETLGADEKEIKPVPLIKEEFGTYIALSLVIVGAVFCLFFVVVKPMLASSSLIEALSLMRTANTDEVAASLEKFKEAISYKTFGTTETREQLSQRAMAVARASELDMMTKQTLFQYARDEMVKQIEVNPGDARYRVFQGALYSAYGMYGDAIKEFTFANELSPRKQTIFFELIAANINTGNIPAALELAKKAFDLDPSYTEARNIYAVAAIYAKKNDIAKQILTEAYGTELVNDDRIINAYASSGQYDKVIGIWKLRIAADPNNAQLHIYLSASYLAAGQKENSIAELKKAVEINPAFKDQADSYIKDIRAGRMPK